MRKLFLPLLAAVLTLTSCYKEETNIIILPDGDNGYVLNENPSDGGNTVGFRLVPSTTSSRDFGGSTLNFNPYVEKGATVVGGAARSNGDSNFPLNFYTGASPLSFVKDGTTRYSYNDVNYQTLGSRAFSLVSGTYSYTGSAGDSSLGRSDYLPFTLVEGPTFMLPSTNVVDLSARTAHSIVTVNDISTGSVFGTPQISVGSAPLADLTGTKTWNGDSVDYAYIQSGNSFELSVPWSVTVSGTLYSGVVTRTISNIATYTHYAYNLNMVVQVLQSGQVNFNIVFENPFTLRTETVTATQVIDPTSPVAPPYSVEGSVTVSTDNYRSGTRTYGPRVSIALDEDYVGEAGDILEVFDASGAVVFTSTFDTAVNIPANATWRISSEQSVVDVTEIGQMVVIRRPQ